jgi:hypothetical protein
MRRVTRIRIATVLLVGLVGASPHGAFGQSNYQFGLTIGGTWVNTASPQAPSGGYLSFQGGALLRRQLLGPLSAQAELSLAQRGVEISGPDGGSIQYGAGYLQLPLLAYVEAPVGGSVAVHAEAGGYAALKIFERQTPGGDVNAAFDAGPSFFRRVDTGMMVGGGATVTVAQQRLNLTLRREWGVPDVAQTVGTQPFAEAPFPDEAEIRAWVLMLRVGL